MENDINFYVEKWIKSRCLSKVPAAIPPKLLGNKEFVMEVMEKIPLKFPLLGALPDKLKNDKDVVKLAVKSFPTNGFYISEKLLKDKEVILYIIPYVIKDGNFEKPYHYYTSRDLVKKWPDKIREDKEVRIAVLSRRGDLITELCKDERCDDRDVALAVISSGDGWSFHYCSKRLLDDKELVLLAINYAGSSLLGYISDRLKADREVVLEASKHSGCGFQYASDSLRDDKEIALLAVSHSDGYDSSYVSEVNCRVDTPYKFVSPRLKADYDVASLAIKTNVWAYRYAPKEIKMDRELALFALGSYIFDNTQLGIPAELFDDKEFVLRIVPKKRYLFRFASSRLKADLEVVKVALDADPGNYCYLPHELQIDKDIILKVAQDDIGGLHPASGKVIKRDDKYFLVVTFDKKSILLSANMIRAFSGVGTTKDEQAEINSVADGLAKNAEYDDQVIEIEVSEEYLLNSKIKSYYANRYPPEIIEKINLSNK